jgi:hypothetical protein
VIERIEQPQRVKAVERTLAVHLILSVLTVAGIPGRIHRETRFDAIDQKRKCLVVPETISKSYHLKKTRAR